jgi:hypothetical protein
LHQIYSHHGKKIAHVFQYLHEQLRIQSFHLLIRIYLNKEVIAPTVSTKSLTAEAASATATLVTTTFSTVLLSASFESISGSLFTTTVSNNLQLPLTGNPDVSFSLHLLNAIQ